MKKNTHPIISSILDNLGLVIIDRSYFGLSEQESMDINTLDFIKKVCSDGKLMICTADNISDFTDRISREVVRIKNLLASRSLPKYIIIPESVHDKYYRSVTVLFRRRMIFQVYTSVKIDDVYGSSLFERKIIFKKPS